ncbi:gliding motility-associated C-terminal domain-containing protein [Flavobacterium sp. GP15]|uniref:DUF7507 domain-containing protein n=1 Tax=Flavobacterium sp. GP15 TaxID=2758567 RepID=UPI00165E420F|nr:gliding motility-associated C-terminal domain-containing protein [Flavobacterium sp. GP15]
MKTKITVFVLTFFLFVSTLYAQQDPDKLGGPVLIGQVAPFALPVAIGSKKLKSDTFALRSLASPNSLEWPNPGAVHIEKTAEAVESGKWKINLMVEGKNIPKSTDLILVIDDSGSMNGTKITSAKEAAKTFVNQLLNGSTDIRIAIVTLNPASGGTTGNPQIDQVFTNNTSSLNTAIDAIVANGGTNIQGGFYAARLLVESSTADKKVVILLSDGDPTYSYNSNIAPPAFTVGCGSISNFNISRSDYENNYLKVSSSIYTNVVGDGNNFNFTLFTTTCGNKTFNAGNHGIPTIYEAKKIISDGADIYTIGFEVPANGAAESTLMGSQNKGYFPANSSNISNIYSQIRSNISYAATNAVLTDPMSTFILLSANVTPTYTVLPITTGNVVVSKGSVNFSNNGFVLNDPDNPASGNSNIVKWKITWNIGTVSELGDNMYYFVTMAPNTDTTILYDANEKTFMDYTDVNGNTNAHQETPTNFTVPKVSGGKGSIEIIYYTVNDAGEPINSVGTVVTKENAVKLIPGNSKYFEINGSTALEVNQNYTVVPDINYLSNSILYNLYCNLGSIIVTPIPSDPNKKVWFGYVVNSTPKVTNVEYCINSPAVPLTATFSAGHTSPTYTIYYFDSLTGTPKTSITPLTTTLGQYTYYVAEGKTTSCIGSKVPIVVSVNALPIAAIASDNGLALSCTTPNTTLTASGGTSYLWSNGATTPAITVSTAGTFSVTVKNANVCSSTASVNTTLDNTLPIAAIASDNGLALSCTTPNTTLTASGGTSYLWSNGATTASIIVTTAGTFSVTVKNANGCSSTASVNTTLDNTLPIATIASDNGLALSCNTPNTTLTASGGTSYLWSNGATTPAITVATAGTFSVTVKNSNGCSATASVNTTLDNTLPIAAIASDNGLTLSCNTPNTTLTASGGSSYLWSNGATTAAITVAIAGTFSVTVKNANGCSATASVNTTLDNTLPIAAIASDNGLALNCNTPNTTLTASGGTSYLWSNGATTAAITVTTAGTFLVTVKNANGCWATASVNTTLDNTLPIAAIASDNGLALSCTTPNTTLTASGGTSYLWSSGATTPAITVATAGTFSVTVKNANGCSATASVNTTLDNTLSIAAIASDNGLALNCTTPNSTLTASGGTSYLWSNGATTAAITVATAGTFSVTVKNSNGCSATASVNTTLDNTLPIAAIASDNGLALSCNTPNTTLTASGGTSYLWSNGATTAAITVATAGTFSVTVKNANGCSATASVNTTLDNALPIAAIASDNGLALSCNTPNTTLTASGGTSYLWSNGATTPAITVTTVGTFSVTVKNSNGCSATALVNTTLDNTLPIAAIASDNGLALSCTTPNTTLTASGGTSYLWSNGATTPAITVATAGTFSVTVKNANGCSATASVTTTLDNALPIAAIASDNGLALSCNIPNTTLTASGGTSYLWSNGATTPAITVATAGTFSVTVRNSNGCSASASVNTTLDNSLPIISISSQTDAYCFGENNGTISIITEGGKSPYTYEWTKNNIAYSTSKDLIGLSQGIYKVIATSANGCSSDELKVIIQQPNAAITATAIIIDNTNCVGCSNGSITQTISGGTLPYTYLWSNGATTKDLTGLIKGNYSVEIKDKNSCVANYSYSIQESGIALVKKGIFYDSNTDGFAQAGEIINYTFIVTNTGNVTINSIVITDPMKGLTIKNNSITSLNAGENATLTGIYILTQADINAGKVINSAVAIGKDPKGNEVKDISGTQQNNDTATETPLNQKASIAITKDGIYVDANKDGITNLGDKIVYSFVLINTGDVILTQVNISDNLEGLVITGSPITLQIGESNATSFSATYSITQADIDSGLVYNLATVTGTTPYNDKVTATSTDPTQCMNCVSKTDCKDCTITTLNQSANLVVYKTAAVTGYSLVGEIINYKIIVRNSGNVTLHQIVVTDPLTGLNTIISVLAPGTEQEFNESYTITKNDLDNNSVINIANAKGLTPTNAEIKASDTVEIDKAFVLGCRSIVVHNAFSPNGDGINDVFTIDDISETNCYPENTVEIYNRWGVLIFRTKNYNNQTNNFDGISQGRTTVSESTGLPSGTYFYILNYTSIDGNGTIQNNKKEGFLYLTK